LAEPRPPHNRLVFWNVGQGDFISYLSHEVCIVFDVGGSFKIPEKDLLEMRNFCPQRKVQLFISHFDKDHISNYKRLMTYLVVENSYFSHLDSRSQFGKKLLEQLKFQNSKTHQIRQGFKIKYEGVHLSCLWPPPGPLRKAENDRSLVLKLENQGRSFLFMGDLPSRCERKLPLVSAQVLKVGHHGSKYSSSSSFLKNVKASMCVVSVGRINTYGHPSPDALSRMNDNRCTILRTDLLGDITIEL